MRRKGGLAPRTKQIAWDTRATCRLDTFTLQDAFIHNYGSHDDLLERAWPRSWPDLGARGSRMNEAVQDARARVTNTASLAVHGGEPVRKTPMPPRLALGEDERQDGDRGARLLRRAQDRSRLSRRVREDLYRRFRRDDGRRLRRCGRDRNVGALRCRCGARSAQGQRGHRLADHGSRYACGHCAQRVDAAARGQQAGQLQCGPGAVRRSA